LSTLFNFIFIFFNRLRCSELSAERHLSIFEHGL
jgi:hypothetical protein